MGNAVSGVIAEASKSSDDNQKQVIADMKNLQEVLEAKANEFFVKLVNNKGEDKSVPIKTLIEYKKHISASVSSGPSQKLNEAIESLFGGNFMASLKAMALGAIDTVLGNTSAGSKEESGYKVLLLHNTIVRVDYYVYGFNMYTAGLLDKSRNGLAFVATVGVVDMKSVGLEALVYLVGAQANEARAFISQRFDDYALRLKNMAAIKRDLESESTTLIDMASLSARNDFYDLDTMTQYLDEADSEIRSEKTNPRLGSASSTAAMPDEIEDVDKMDSATQTLEDARAAAMQAWLAFKSKQSKMTADQKRAAAAEEFQTYKAAWVATAARAIPATNGMIRAHKDLLRGMTNEQMSIMEDIKTVYLRARSVTNVISGSQAAVAAA